MISWLVKIATSPIQLLDEFYPDRSNWDVYAYLIRMYYHELEKSRPGIWDKVYDKTQVAKAVYEAQGHRGNGLAELVRRDFDKHLQVEMRNAYKAIEGEFENRIHTTDKVINKNWARIQQQTVYGTPEEALHGINEQKTINLYGWMNELHDTEQEPAFKYIVMQQLVKKYGKDKLMPPPEVDAEILAKVSEIVYTGNGMQEDGNPIKFWDLWQSATMAVQSAESFTGHGWVKYPQGSDPHKLKNAVQGSGWCIASLGLATSYLEGGDVHIYFDGKAQVAMRVRGDKADEISERFNDPISTYAAEVVEYADGNRIIIDEGTSGYEGLQTALEINSKIDTDPDYARHFNEQIRNNPDMFGYLKRDYKKVPGYRTAYVDAIIESFNTTLTQFSSNAITLILDSVDNSILQEYNQQFFEAAKATCLRSDVWFLENVILDPNNQNQIIVRLATDPEVIAHVKQLHLVKKQEMKYNTTGQGQADRSPTLDKWFQEDPEFFEAAKDVLLVRIGPVNTVAGAKVSPNKAMFMLTENNTLVASAPEVIEALRQKTLHYLKNNPDTVKMTQETMGNHNRSTDIPEPVESAEYEAIVNNVDNWLWLLSPNHPRQNGTHYHTVGMHSEYDLSEMHEQIDEKQRINLLVQNISIKPEKLLSNLQWPLNRELGLSSALTRMPRHIWSDPRIMDRVADLVVPIWQQSIETTLDEPKQGQPYNPYDSQNQDMLKMGHRYIEASILDEMRLSSHPSIKQAIEQLYHNPQFLYSVVRHQKVHLIKEAQNEEEAIKRVSLPNTPIPNDPSIYESIREMRKEEAKQFLTKLNAHEFSRRPRRTGDLAGGLDMMDVVEKQRMDMPKGQIRRNSEKVNFTSLSQDLQDDPEMQKFFDDRFHDELDARRYVGGLQSPFVIPRHLWEQEGFKEHEKDTWIKTLSEGYFDNVRAYQHDEGAQWYPNAVIATWLSIPDHLKSDPEIQQAMDKAIDHITHSLLYNVHSLQHNGGNVSQNIIDDYNKHKEVMQTGDWMQSPFRKIQSYDLDQFVKDTEIIHTIREKLSAAGYDSPLLAGIDELNKVAVTCWNEIELEVKQKWQEEQDKFKLDDVFPPVQATSWLARLDRRVRSTTQGLKTLE